MLAAVLAGQCFLALRLGTGLFLRREPIRMWARPVAPSATENSSYRAAAGPRRSDDLACVMSGVPVALLALALGPPMLVIGGVSGRLCFLAALAMARCSRSSYQTDFTGERRRSDRYSPLKP